MKTGSESAVLETTRLFQLGERAYVNGRQVVIVRQVLFNRPAYRVRSLRPPSNMSVLEWGVDGSYISTDPRRRVGRLGADIEEELSAESTAA